jgi:hypothetical protein
MGVGIVSSCPHEDPGAAPFLMSREDHISVPMFSQDVEDVEGGRQDVEYSMDIDKDMSDFVEYEITEDDLNDILRDVEEELLQDGNRLVSLLNETCRILSLILICSQYLILNLRGTVFGRSLGS